MAFNGFLLRIAWRVLVLLGLLLVLSYVLTAEGHYAGILLFSIAATLSVFELFNFVSLTNRELVRFLQSARYGDYSQNFGASLPDAGFGELAGSFHDVLTGIKGARRRTEIEVNRLKSLTENLPVPVLSVHQDGRIDLHNAAARKLLGGVTKLADLKDYGPELAEAVESAQPGEKSLSGYYEEGKYHRLSLQTTVVATGTTKEKLISLSDIQNELEIAQSTAWQELVRVLTHEIMNSITPITSLAKTAATLTDEIKNSGAPTDEDLLDLHEALTTVAARSDGLMQFVNSYRSLSLLPKPEKRSIHIASLVRQALGLVSGDKIQAAVQIEPEDLELKADPSLVEQLLINLVKNGAEALADTVDPKITIDVRRNLRSRVEITVADNGPGIAPELAAKVFMPFFTTKPTGSGVGLALARQIMISHGGSIHLKENPGSGACFVLTF